MNEKELLEQLNKVSQNLDASEICIGKNDWDSVLTLFNEIDTIQSKIKSNNPDVETLIQENSEFKEQFEAIKAILEEKTAHVIAVVEDWKVKHTEKISDSKDLLDNIAKYYKPTQTSYYFDRNE
jgi:regulator of replication initiation timing